MASDLIGRNLILFSETVADGLAAKNPYKKDFQYKEVAFTDGNGLIASSNAKSDFASLTLTYDDSTKYIKITMYPRIIHSLYAYCKDMDNIYATQLMLLKKHNRARFNNLISGISSNPTTWIPSEINTNYFRDVDYNELSKLTLHANSVNSSTNKQYALSSITTQQFDINLNTLYTDDFSIFTDVVASFDLNHVKNGILFKPDYSSEVFPNAINEFHVSDLNPINMVQYSNANEYSVKTIRKSFMGYYPNHNQLKVVTKQTMKNYSTGESNLSNKDRIGQFYTYISNKSNGRVYYLGSIQPYICIRFKNNELATLLKNKVITYNKNLPKGATEISTSNFSTGAAAFDNMDFSLYQNNDLEAINPNYNYPVHIPVIIGSILSNVSYHIVTHSKSVYNDDASPSVDTNTSFDGAVGPNEHFHRYISSGDTILTTDTVNDNTNINGTYYSLLQFNGYTKKTEYTSKFNYDPKVIYYPKQYCTFPDGMTLSSYEMSLFDLI